MRSSAERNWSIKHQSKDFGNAGLSEVSSSLIAHLIDTLHQMPKHEAATLRRWARGEFYPLNQEEQPNALERLRDAMSAGPSEWWKAFQAVFKESDEHAVTNLNMPLAALLDAGGDALRDEVAQAARDDRSFTNSYWDAMYDLSRQLEAYGQLGRSRTKAAFVRHYPHIPVSADSWSADVIFWLVEEQPDEAWELGLELLDVSMGEHWPHTIGAFIIEDLLHDHGDAFIDRLEAEAKHNERLRMSLPTTEWRVPEHLLERVKAAAGPYWNRKHSP